MVFSVLESDTISSLIRMINATKSRPFSPTVRESSGRKTSSPDSEFSMHIENEIIERNWKKLLLFIYLETTSFREASFLGSPDSLSIQNGRRLLTNGVARRIHSITLLQNVG